ncbi:hypothetical protein NDU88_002715 [Pleurodeles waltl]|uniref:Uncharacterized protein n=1 Tax=Pleurodeles waltl TaxID=8319 RepID=A0AAV7T466_PLEWA|nr:hypothetical protein NDU88_002715 [Pleurodeles waltl]
MSKVGSDNRMAARRHWGGILRHCRASDQWWAALFQTRASNKNGKTEMRCGEMQREGAAYPVRPRRMESTRTMRGATAQSSNPGVQGGTYGSQTRFCATGSRAGKCGVLMARVPDLPRWDTADWRWGLGSQNFVISSSLVRNRVDARYLVDPDGSRQLWGEGLPPPHNRRPLKEVPLAIHSPRGLVPLMLDGSVLRPERRALRNREEGPLGDWFHLIKHLSCPGTHPSWENDWTSRVRSYEVVFSENQVAGHSPQRHRR